MVTNADNERVYSMAGMSAELWILDDCFFTRRERAIIHENF